MFCEYNVNRWEECRGMGQDGETRWFFESMLRLLRYGILKYKTK